MQRQRSNGLVQILKGEILRARTITVLAAVIVVAVGLAIYAETSFFHDLGSGPNRRTHIALILLRFAAIEGSLSNALMRDAPTLQKTFSDQWETARRNHRDGAGSDDHESAYATPEGTVVYANYKYEYTLVFTPVRRPDGIKWRCEKSPGGPSCTQSRTEK